jgi:hypothetical protein
VVRASTGLPYPDPEADAPRRYHDFCIHEPRASSVDGAAGGAVSDRLNRHPARSA